MQTGNAFLDGCWSAGLASLFPACIAWRHQPCTLWLLCLGNEAANKLSYLGTILQSGSKSGGWMMQQRPHRNLAAAVEKESDCII